ncbi:sodium-coupled monocarboxylate transporter 1-like [Elgaria multicarinata webbii]|uniref:sodium-coupled monocarboxylate transporter 1-like n=1 Tax=Elgaria multicarinata webbii TaxID=159646 RepID=UPI002FCCEEE0
MRERFIAIDYFVFTAMLLFCAAIGIFYAIRGVHKSHNDYVMAGRNLSCWPVSLSLTASFMSAVTVLGTPAEIYRFGLSFGLFAITYIFMVVISAEVFLPVYYRLGITSTYEYLELRYNRYMRLLGTVMFMTLTTLYTGIVIYSPSLALNQVTGFQLWGSVISTGIVCTFYCALGGLKAVVWTDVFQFVLMISGFIAVIARTVVIRGGFGPIIEDARRGGRLSMWDFNPNPLQRHTVWTVVIGGTFTWLGIYGVNQSQVQRYLACKTQLHAKMALYLNLVGLWITLSSAAMSGLSMYSIYKNCDPWTAKYVLAPDQLIPYFVLEILGDFPGVPGLFVAGTYSGTLSTVSSSINALAAVTVEDLIKPYFTVSESKLSWISMGMNLFFGAICLSMAAIASVMGALLQAALSIFGIIGGPLLGIFSMGVLLPFANAKGAFSGLLCGFFTVLWVGIGSQKYPPRPNRTFPLPLSTEGCPRPNFTMVTQVATTMLPPRPAIQEYWYSLSYLYFSALGTLTTMIVGSVVSVVTGGLKQEVDPRLLFHKEDFMEYFMNSKTKCVSVVL